VPAPYPGQCSRPSRTAADQAYNPGEGLQPVCSASSTMIPPGRRRSRAGARCGLASERRRRRLPLIQEPNLPPLPRGHRSSACGASPASQGSQTSAGRPVRNS
jgi:hypothetical protein